MQNKIVNKLIIVIPFLFIPFIRTDKTLDSSLYIQFGALAVFLLLFWLFVVHKKDKILITNKKAFYFLLVYAAYLVYSVINVLQSINTSDAIFELSKMTLFFIFMVTVAFFYNSGKHFNNIAKSLLLFGFIIAIVGYFQLLSLLAKGDLEIPRSTNLVQSIFPIRNFFTEILVLIIPLTIYAYSIYKGFWRYLGIITFNLAFFLIIILSNRASWLALLFSGIFISSLFLLKYKTQFFKAQKSLALNIVLLLLASFAFFAKFSDTSSLKEHTSNTVNLNKGSTKERIGLWKRTAELIKEKPIFGNGLQSWKVLVLKFGNKGLISENNTTFFQRPHNDYLWILAEQGIVGFCIYLSLILFIIYAASRLFLKQTDVTERNQTASAIFIIIGYLVLAMFSFPKERIEHNIILFFAFGFIIQKLNSPKNSNSQYSYQIPVKFIGLILLIGISIISFYRLYGAIHTRLALIAKNDVYNEECIEEIEKAKSFCYAIDETSTPLDWYAGLSSYKSGKLEEAKTYFDAAYKLNPWHIYVLNDYGSCLIKLNQQEKGIKMYLRALSIAPNFTDAKLNLCAMYFKNNEINKAFDVVKSIDSIAPSERYKKTVLVIIKRIIEDNMKITQPNPVFLHLYKQQFNNFDFYLYLLEKSKQTGVSIKEIINNKQYIEEISVIFSKNQMLIKQ